MLGVHVSHSVMSNSCDPMRCSPPGSSVHGTLQARILEWVATPFSRGSSWPGDRTQISCTAGRLFTIWATREAPKCWGRTLSLLSPSSEIYQWANEDTTREGPQSAHFRFLIPSSCCIDYYHRRWYFQHFFSGGEGSYTSPPVYSWLSWQCCLR